MTEFGSFVHEFSTSSIISDALYDIARSAPEAEWTTHLDQNLILPSKDLLMSDPVLASFMDKFPPGKRMLIFRNMPHTAYSWHRDANRKVAINMLLHGSDCITLVGIKNPPGTTLNPNSMHDLHKVPLLKNKYYLVNVGESHAVYNYGNDIRYLLSISVPLPTEFATAKEFVIENNL